MTAFLLPSGPPPGARSRLMKADAVAARSATAQRQAAETVERETRAQVDDAYRRGLEAGRLAAEAEGASAALRGAAAVEQLAAESARLSAEAVDLGETAVLGAVLELTGWVLRAEPSQASRSLLDRLSAAARSLTPGPSTVVRCSAEDVDAVTGWARAGVEVVADPRLAPGEARLDRGQGSAVLTFSAALRRAADALGLPVEETDSFATGPGGPR